MKKIGLTGGIGSGKTTVARFFNILGIPVFFADTISRKIVSSDPEVKHAIIQLLGEDAFINNEYNRPYVASRVFQDKQLLEKLNQIIHPATLKAFDDWVSQQNTPYIIKEAAILFESGSHKGLDKTITVNAPEEVRLHRVLRRDDTTPAQVKSRMMAQFSDEQRSNVADFIILNDDVQPIIPQVLEIHKTIISSL